MKYNKKDIPILLLCIGTVVFPFVLRETLLGKFALLNVPVWLALCYAFREKIVCLSSKKSEKWMLISYLLAATLLLFFVPGNGWSIKRKILLILIYILPSVFICCDIFDDSYVYRYQKIWTNCLRIVCCILCLCWFFDAIAGEPYLQSVLANFYARENLVFMISEKRFVSFLGHPLETTGIFLMLLAWGTIERDLYPEHKYMYFVDVAISVFGISVCGSKSAFLLAILLLVFSNLGPRRIKDLLVVIAILFVFWMMGTFDLILSRSAEGVASGDISTGRLTALKELTEKGVLKFNLLQGHLYEYDNVTMTAALEFPFLGWSFTCGILFTIVQYLIYFVYPGMKVLLSKNVTILICMLILMAFENGSNGIYSFNDDLLIYSLNMWLTLQIATRNNRRGI